MKRGFVIFLLLAVPTFSIAQYLSESSVISLLTASPGEELYSTFGHSAIRVKDQELNLDIVFNYGTFDSGIPNFYIKFARRKVDYMLSVSEFDAFAGTYVYENRSIIEQVLNLDSLQKNRLYSLLLENYLPENRYYRYDFFFDNCATRIRDIMITAFGGDFHYNYPEAWSNGNMTFRNLIDLYLTNHHWSDFGIDLALGLPTDDIASPSDYMFLPDYLKEGFETATIISDGAEMHFVLNNHEIIPREEIQSPTFFITPVRLMWTLFGICALLTFLSVRRGKNTFWFDILYFSAIGLGGWMVFSLWFLTDHIATKDNLNLLWAVPLYFPLFLFWERLSKTFKIWYIYLCGGLDVLILLLWLVFPQQYHLAFIPMILIMILRFIVLLKSEKLKPLQVNNS